MYFILPHKFPPIVLVPCTHLYKGKIGLKGHTVMFNKHIEDICNELPRKKVNMICLIKEYTTTTTNELRHQKFLIRRDKVLNALYWLKQHHPGYTNIRIAEENLDWMGKSSEKYLNRDSISFLKTVTQEINSNNKECANSTSVSTQQTCDSVSKPMEIFGISPTSPSEKRTEDINIKKKLEQTMKSVGAQVSPLMFPKIDEEPINEFCTNRMFANAYPWLFPGGLGDITNTNKKGKEAYAFEWAERLLRWPDGRFMSDELFSFHLPNFLTRHVNNNSGFFFVSNYIEEKNISIEEVQEQIRGGNTDFVKKIINYAGNRIRGSDAWWRYRRHELNSWISYHLKEGHGPPTLFMTFSCAEYWWDDMLTVLFKRIQDTNDKEKVLLCQHNPTSNEAFEAKCYLVDTYTAIIQEYFQLRLDNWMETIGKDVFEIKYYWGRFEFTKGRGQIHAHVLGIPSNLHLLHTFYEMWKINKDEKKATQLLSEYVRDRFDLSEELPTEEKSAYKVPNINPISIPYCQVQTNDAVDKINCVKKVHIHKCNKFCLRLKRNK